MNPWLSTTIVQALGWTLVHFLWQGLVIAALLAAGLRIFRSGPAHYKYLAACAAMALMALALLVTFRLVLSQPEPLPAITPISAKISTIETSTTFTLNQPTRTATPELRTTGFFERLDHLLPWLVLGWLAGVCALSCRLFLGWLQVRRLRRTATHPLPSPWPEKLAALAQRLGVNRSIQLLQSALIEVPTVIGWLRPVILLPASCLTGLTPGQLEAIIAHELAHIRRHDYLVNLLQSTIETLLFYHPAVWWVSRRIRDERENCCDDLAVEVSGDLVGYARALATLEELRPASAQLMLAAAGAPLLQRIRRLAGQPERSAGRASWPVAGIVVLLVLGILTAGRMEHRAAAMPQLADETNTNQLPPLEIRTFHVDPKVFIQRLRSALGNYYLGDTYSSGTNAMMAATIRMYFALVGVDLSTKPGEVIIFNEVKGTLTVRATSQNLDKIEAALGTLMNSAPSSGENGPTVTNGTRPLQVKIEVKFVELPVKDGETNWGIIPAGTEASSNAAHTVGTITGLLTDSQFHATIEALERRDGTDVLTPPRVTTESGRQAQLQAVDIQQIVTSSGLGFGTNSPAAAKGIVVAGAITPAFAPGTTVLSAGPTVDVIPYVLGDGKSIDLTIIPSLTEFIGYDYPSNVVRGDFAPAGGVPAPPNPMSPPVGSPTAPQTSAPFGGGVTSVLPLPHFRLRQVTVNVTAWDGQTVVIGGLASRGSTNNLVEEVPLLGNLPYVGRLFRSESTQTIAKKQLLVFVTVTIVNPGGTPYRSDEERRALWTNPPPQQKMLTNR
jgi:beta-lactamase regulating signal transducer with metallopeptidase domain